ncbi:MAG: response regulator transcription factor [Luteolibacter sp.]
MRVLYVEDSESLRRSVRRALEHRGHTVDVAGNGREGLDATLMHDYDVIVLDVMMPEMDGLTLLRHLRKSGVESHVLLLTARDTIEDRVHGLREGADDYLVKPFALEELLARVDALGRRRHGMTLPVLALGPLALDFAARKVTLEGVEIELTAREWKLLECLARRRDQVVPRAEIEEQIYDDKVEPMSNVVDTAIYGLRRKIGSGFIHTRRGLGYILSAP